MFLLNTEDAGKTIPDFVRSSVIYFLLGSVLFMLENKTVTEVFALNGIACDKHMQINVYMNRFCTQIREGGNWIFPINFKMNHIF